MRFPHFSYTQTQEGQVRGEREQRGDVITLRTLTSEWSREPRKGSVRGMLAGCFPLERVLERSWHRQEAGPAASLLLPVGGEPSRLISGRYIQSHPSALRSPKLGREACSGGPPCRSVRTPAGWLPCGPVFTTPGDC